MHCFNAIVISLFGRKCIYPFQFQGQLNENALEAMHKILRYLLKWRARPFLIEGLTDAYNHLWIKSSYFINSFSGEPPKKLGPMPMKTEDDLYVASFIIQDED